MKIYIGSDHAGFKLKREIIEFLNEEKYEVRDLGPYKFDKDDDYPDYAVKVCEKVLDTNGYGILVCGTGLGMARTANKIPGISADNCWDEFTARMAKEHGKVNVLCLGARILESNLAKRIVKTWLESSFIPEERHVRRINKIKELERKYKYIPPFLFYNPF